MSFNTSLCPPAHTYWNHLRGVACSRGNQTALVNNLQSATTTITDGCQPHHLSLETCFVSLILTMSRFKVRRVSTKSLLQSSSPWLQNRCNWSSYLIRSKCSLLITEIFYELVNDAFSYLFIRMLTMPQASKFHLKICYLLLFYLITLLLLKADIRLICI